MGYLREGKSGAFFIRLDDEHVEKVERLMAIFKRTKKKRIKDKIARRIDNMIPVEVRK